MTAITVRADERTGLVTVENGPATAVGNIKIDIGVDGATAGIITQTLNFPIIIGDTFTTMAAKIAAGAWTAADATATSALGVVTFVAATGKVITHLDESVTGGGVVAPTPPAAGGPNGPCPVNYTQPVIRPDTPRGIVAASLPGTGGPRGWGF